MGYILIIIILIIIIILLSILSEHKDKDKDTRIGYVKMNIPSEYSTIWNKPCHFKIKPTGLEFENGTIEIEVIEILNFHNNSYANKLHAFNICKKNFKIINKNLIIWETLKPLNIINADDLGKLLNDEEVILEDNIIKLDRKYAYDEIINIMLK